MTTIPSALHDMVSLKTGKDVATLAYQYDPLKLACPVCNTIYETVAEATKCRDQPYDDGDLAVGTIVAVPGKSAQFPLDDPWLAFVWAGYRVPLFVVTAIHGEPRDEHHCVVTLVSLCGSHLTSGWNPATGEGHLAMFRIDGGKHCMVNSFWFDKVKDHLAGCNPSDKMREEAKRLARIGISSDELL